MTDFAIRLPEMLTNSDANPSLTCSLCGRPVEFLVAQTDEFGKTVHAECFEFRVSAGGDPDRTF